MTSRASLRSTIMTDALSLQGHKLLVANRGEIAVRILRTAKQLGLQTVAIYTQVDATSPHVSLADEAVALSASQSHSDNNSSDPLIESNISSNAKAYLDADAIVNICKERRVTLVHPGYGFLSENADFARLLARNDVTLLGPHAETIENMGLKHLARDLAIQAEVPIVPGSSGLVDNLASAKEIARDMGYPVILKATAGGGGMGLVVCRTDDDLHEKFETSKHRAKSIFNNEGLFIEKFFDVSRHIEVQIFGNGCNHVIHMGERECSVQRRHQKILEESPSPYLSHRPDLRDRMCSAAVRLGKLINYKSAGTVEFLVVDTTGDFYFLEMNTRLQVEHGVTEMLYPGLDIVELMILQGVHESRFKTSSDGDAGLPPNQLKQENFEHPTPMVHVIEARVYSESPATNFSPSPGILQFVKFPKDTEDLRIDTWVSTGISISPFYDPLIAKIIVRSLTRDAVIAQLSSLLDQGNQHVDAQIRVAVQGPPNNLGFLVQTLQHPIFLSGNATTEWIDRGGIEYVPNAFTVLSPGINTSVQSLPTRDIGLGIPPSGPMDPVAFQAGNALVGNSFGCEGLELVIPSTTASRSSGLFFTAVFHVQAQIAVTGADATVRIDGNDVPTWARVVVPKGSSLVIGSLRPCGKTSSGGFRAYLTIFGGFPGIPRYLGSKSTSTGSGGYQGRALQAGDILEITPLTGSIDEPASLPRALVPSYPSDWTIYSLPGPHDDTEFLTASGIDAFYMRKWRVSSNSNRMGIRLEPVPREGSDEPALEWSRSNGGEGGSHPSNILDNGYARGSVNLNGDTPVILTVEGPSMGGYLCISTIASTDQWKVGQMRPGDQLQFRRITYSDSMSLQRHVDKWLETVLALSSGFSASPVHIMDFSPSADPPLDPKLHCIHASPSKPKAVFRQAGDSAILVEYGDMTLDVSVRARIHGLESGVRQLQIPGIMEYAPCIRSTMIHFDSRQISQADVLDVLIRVESSLPESIEEMRFPGRRLTFPIVLDDRWNRETLQRYMRSTRDRAVYLPSNIDYLARNNGIEEGAEKALELLVSSPWLVFGVGFYLACPFLVPIDPRCRIVGQKMNPSRTHTPRGAVGIAGLVAAIYPVESPGGYQLFGRTLPAWQPWGRGTEFSPDRPWLLEPFDQVLFEPVSEEKYTQMEKDFDGGRYSFKIEAVTFSMEEYMGFVTSIEEEVTAFRRHQARGVELEEARELVLLKEWQESRQNNNNTNVVTENAYETPYFVTASLSGTIWKLKAGAGDFVATSDQVLVILEAMKTEISVTAGEENVGRRIAGFAMGVKEGTIVQAGDKLVFFLEA